MAKLVVKPVETRRERRQFLWLPWTLYRDDPNWTPPLRAHQKQLVGYARHPFYRENEAQTFLALRDGRPCGRIAAIMNRAHNERYGERRGFFGFFESINDQQTAARLFDAVREWFAERDVLALRGPCCPSLNYEVGLLVRGFHCPAMFMMPYNPPYYQQLVEQYGFRKAQDLYAYWGHVDMLQTLQDRLTQLAEQTARRLGVTTRPLDRKHFYEEVRRFVRVYNQSLENTWGFTPLSDAEIEHMARSLRWLLAPELTCGAFIGDELVGACFAMLDYNPRIKEINGRLLPLGFLRLLRKRREIRQGRLISANVLPQYQMAGVGLVLFARILRDAIQWGLQEAEFSWVLESNTLSRKSLEHGGAIRTKTYRVYDL